MGMLDDDESDLIALKQAATRGDMYAQRKLKSRGIQYHSAPQHGTFVDEESNLVALKQAASRGDVFAKRKLREFRPQAPTVLHDTGPPLPIKGVKSPTTSSCTTKRSRRAPVSSGTKDCQTLESILCGINAGDASSWKELRKLLNAGDTHAWEELRRLSENNQMALDLLQQMQCDELHWKAINGDATAYQELRRMAEQKIQSALIVLHCGFLTENQFTDNPTIDRPQAKATP